jgi:hypothetical protein
MARPIIPAQSEQRLSIDRRLLLTSAAALTTSGFVPRIGLAKAAKPAEVANMVETPSLEIRTLNVCATTAWRLEKIAQRNRIREEVGLPLLSVAKELRRMKTEADLNRFRRFAAVHHKAVWDEVLKRVQDDKGNQNWHPRSFMEAVDLQARVSKILHERFALAEFNSRQSDPRAASNASGNPASL